jgi:hypothetical protein
MQRPNANPDDMQPGDFACDFCLKPWDGASPVVEGHRGSLICGDCLAAAYRLLGLQNGGNAPDGYTCVMCLEERKEPGWAGATGAVVCKRCGKQSAAVLANNTDYKWIKPTLSEP